MDYFGSNVNLTARVSDSAHGGQICVTKDVIAEYEKAKEDPDFQEWFPSPLIVKDMGHHQFKGVSEDVTVYQLSSPELATRQFPPLRTPLSKTGRNHKLLPEERKGFENQKEENLVEPESPQVSGLSIEHLSSCGNPDCKKVESFENHFGFCARCKAIKYCSVNCQKAHWRTHKKECKQAFPSLTPTASATPPVPKPVADSL